MEKGTERYKDLVRVRIFPQSWEDLVMTEKKFKEKWGKPSPSEMKFLKGTDSPPERKDFLLVLIAFISFAFIVSFVFIL